ncbi:hypothetical protein Tco_0823839 [Tanacetum coccineum]|uniref:Uncharacterized protein n=1 Tax=Tanacetum coccineum TaxID=301880 RepID=A0ABQ5AJ49_9ASTR
MGNTRRHKYAVSSLMDMAYWMSELVFFIFLRLSSRMLLLVVVVVVVVPVVIATVVVVVVVLVLLVIVVVALIDLVVLVAFIVLFVVVVVVVAVVVCKGYGTVVDVFIPDCKAKAGKRNLLKDSEWLGRVVHCITGADVALHVSNHPNDSGGICIDTVSA